MKIYRVLDRLLDHWGPPFAASSEKEVLASVAAIVNSGEKTNAITQAPHHFQVYEVAKITDTEYVQGGYKTLVCDCASLIRGSVREEPTTKQHPHNTMAKPAPEGAGRLNQSLQTKSPGEPTPAVPAQPEDWKTQKTNQ